MPGSTEAPPGGTPPQSRPLEDCAPAPRRPAKIVSGGQTGVDRGALDAALETGTAVGGWCPQGRIAEDGVIPDRYPLNELAGAGYRQRTRRNVTDSDGTVIIHFDRPEGGTAQTLAFCIREGKPHVLVDAARLPVARAAREIGAFVERNGIRVLNVAGPRASARPQAYEYARSVVRRVLNERDLR